MKFIGALIFVFSIANTGCSGVGFSDSNSSSSSKAQGTGGTGGSGGGGTGSTGGNGSGGDISGGGNGLGDDDPYRDVGGLDLTPSNCTNAVNNITYPLKITFLVDASGSNKASSSEKTDPDRNFRYYSIASFLTKFAAKTNFSYQMVHFQGSSASTYINSPTTSMPYFGTANELWEALNYFKNNVSDGGRTPYKAAFNAGKYVIENGGVDAPNTRYVVILVTDGMPTDYLKTVTDPTGYSVVDAFSNGTYSVVDESSILTDAVNVVGIKPGKTTLSTVFYGRNNQSYTAAAKLRLQNIAVTGSGKFFDASLLQQIHVEDTISVPGLACTTK